MWGGFYWIVKTEFQMWTNSCVLFHLSLLMEREKILTNFVVRLNFRNLQHCATLFPASCNRSLVRWNSTTVTSASSTLLTKFIAWLRKIFSLILSAGKTELHQVPPAWLVPYCSWIFAFKRCEWQKFKIQSVSCCYLTFTIASWHRQNESYLQVAENDAPHTLPHTFKDKRLLVKQNIFEMGKSMGKSRKTKCPYHGGLTSKTATRLFADNLVPGLNLESEAHCDKRILEWCLSETVCSKLTDHDS